MRFLQDHILLLLLLLIAILVTFLWLLRFRERLHISRLTALLMAIGQEICGVICVMAFAKLEGSSIGAISIFGAVFFTPLPIWLNAKLIHRPAGELFDILAIPMIFTLLLTRINCLSAGCCYGVPIFGSRLLWPTREAEMLYYAVFLFLMAPKVLKGETDGRVYPLYMGSYGIARGIIEFFRFSHGASSIFHLSHIWAILAIAIGFSIYFELTARGQKRKKNHS